MEHRKTEQAKSNLEDICLIAAFLEGKESAFDELFRKYQGRLFSLCYRFFGSRADAEDAVQEAFLDIYSGLRRFKGSSAFSTWAYRVTVHRCCTRRKKLQIPTVFPDDLANIPEECDSDPVLRLAVRQSLLKLPESARMLLILKYYQQLSYEDISGVLTCSVEQVRDRLRRARLQLKDILDDESRGGLL